jgi:lipopolysaccharide transport system permease protein
MGMIALRATAVPRWADLLHPGTLMACLWKHRGLIGLLTLRELRTRYRGSVLGIAWALVIPLLMLAVYAFAFGLVFPAKWPVTAGTIPVALTLFCGMAFFGLFAECLQRAPSLVASQPQFVKKVVFPLEILPATVLGSALLHWCVHGLLLLLALLLTGVSWSVQLLWLPLVLLPLVFLCLGVGWLLSAVGVFVRDVQNLVGPLATVLTFLSPVFYPLRQLPEAWQMLLRLNPLTTILENARRLLLWHEPPEWEWLLAVTLVTFLFMCVAYACFGRLKRAFADVV